MKKLFWTTVYVLLLYGYVHLIWGEFYSRMFMCILMGMLAAKKCYKYLEE